MDGKIIKSLSDAIASATTTSGIVKLRGKAKNEGISVPSGTDITLDLNGYQLTMDGPGAGSEGTKTLAFQFLKDSNVTIKNGKIVAKETDQIKMLIQNYANLTLDNVELVGTNKIKYLCSNNYGNVKFKNGTKFTVVGDNVAFDAWYGLNSQGLYDNPGVFVELDNSVVVNGKVEFGKQNRASLDNFANGAAITVPTDYQLDIIPSSTVSSGEMKWVDNGDGTKSFKYVKE